LLISKSFEKEKYVFYGIGFVTLLFLGIALHYLVFDHLTDYIFSDYLFYSIYSKFEVGQYIIVYLIISLLFKIAMNWFQLKEKQLEQEKENHKTQMTFLKAQINPHFLFNSLNNIYALTSIDMEKGREHIIKLSDSLRYVLYNTNEERVALDNELEYLSNYINLELLRLESNKSVEIAIEKEIYDQKIAPLILLPFIENCFKHCDKSDPEIKISISVIDNKLLLIAKNNRSETNGNRDGGVGLTNVKKRLDLIYKDKYELNIHDIDNYYKTEFTLELDA